MTIDGETAKDFDDAIYVSSSAEGFTLYVAIADVSHYIKTGSVLERSAFERGTSVYLPDQVDADVAGSLFKRNMFIKTRC